jgi:hypothetical protein
MYLYLLFFYKKNSIKFKKKLENRLLIKYIFVTHTKNYKNIFLCDY